MVGKYVIRILQDETYTGTLVQGRKTTPHFKLKEREDKPSSEWIRVEGTHEAIIQKHDFDLVQRLRRIDTRTSPKSDKVYLFSGILICGCCGYRMTRKTNRYKDQGERKTAGADFRISRQNSMKKPGKRDSHRLLY